MDPDLEMLWLQAARIDTEGVRALIRELDYLRHSQPDARFRFPYCDLREDAAPQK